MLRRWLQRLTARFSPVIDQVTSHPFVRRYLPALADPDLWHMNRRSVSRAVAVGLFCGMIPGPVQALFALGGCLLVRANVPLAIVTTFYTNPFTIVPLYVVAYEYGRLFFPGAPASAGWSLPASAGIADWFPALWQWMASLGKPLAVGLVLLAVTLAAVGWSAVRIGWRCHVVRAWQRRKRERSAA
ncbi:MAG: DUF2062 domain-containing protein [Burkholderiales bacterium]|nr:DUF2062 domain-containing protein [Burkholderiales bacterium]